MSEIDPTPRRYSEKEVGLILRRAAEMQRVDPTGPDATGFTLNELEEIAREAGISVGNLRQAAAEVDRVELDLDFWEKITGGPFRVQLERRIPGELPGERFDGLVPLIQVATEGHGQASMVGRTLTWSSKTSSNTSSQQILVTVQNGETLIRIEDRIGGIAGALFGGMMGGATGPAVISVAMIGGAAGLPLLAAAAPAVILGGAFLGTRKIYQAQVRRHRRMLERLMDRLVERIRLGIAERTVGGARESSEPPRLPGGHTG